MATRHADAAGWGGATNRARWQQHRLEARVCLLRRLSLDASARRRVRRRGSRGNSNNGRRRAPEISVNVIIVRRNQWCAIDELQESRGALLSVLTHPTTGGVLASFASLGDVVIAEPGALMSFAGPRVVAQTTREKLPDDFGLAESNLRFGHLDAIVPRSELRATLAQLLRLFGRS